MYVQIFDKPVRMQFMFNYAIAYLIRHKMHLLKRALLLTFVLPSNGNPAEHTITALFKAIELLLIISSLVILQHGSSFNTQSKSTVTENPSSILNSSTLIGFWCVP